MRLTVHSKNFLRCLSALALLAAGVALIPSSAKAQCVNPAGNAGDTMFNGSYGNMQTCNGTAWKAWQKYNADGWKKYRQGSITHAVSRWMIRCGVGAIIGMAS